MSKTDYPIYNICRCCKTKFEAWTKNSKICDECKKLHIKIRNSSPHYLGLRFEIFKRDNFTCQYCGRNVKENKIKIITDHIIPLSRGGKSNPQNLTTSCEECSVGKGDILLTERKLKFTNPK